MYLDDGEQIMAAWCKTYCGPGWTNNVVEVLVGDKSFKLRLDSLQADEQTAVIRTLFQAEALLNSQILQEVLKISRPRPTSV